MTSGILYLDGPRLRRCLLAGLQRLAEQREYLNRINVFPVPDGDTGNNLVHTAVAGQLALADAADIGSGDTFARLAEAMLDAAQGNSGALLAQFFQGLADGTLAQERLYTIDLARALTSAAASTRKALSIPREGTIISVIDASAAAAREHADTDDFTILLPSMRDAAALALAATTGQLDELRKAGVVDAGAAGFFALLDGCTDFLLHGSVRSAVVIPDAPAVFNINPEHAIGDLRFRFCTECMLTGEALDSAAIRNALQESGDSLVIAGSGRRMRIHIHTSDPENVFRRIAQFGKVDATKADDMLGQARSLFRRNKSVAIVTDSAADLPDEFISTLDVHVVPLRINFGSKSFLDKIGMGSAEFSAELEQSFEQPGTSQPTPGDLRRMYEFLLTHFNEVLSISLSSKLSGTYQAACAAAAAVAGGERIQVLDSTSVSVGQGLIVKRAGEFAAAGLTGAELLAATRGEIAGVQTFALVTDLSNAVRSGRLNPVIKRIADWLHLTPILATTKAGTIGMHGFIPGHRRLVERFVLRILKTTGTAGKWEVAIASGSERNADAALLQTELASRLEEISQSWQTEIGPALGIHSGMTALVVALRKLN